MDFLQWQQTSGGLNVTYNDANQSVTFFIENDLLIPLIAGTPKIYQVFIQMHAVSDEKSLLLNLENIKPVIKRANALVFRPGKALKKVNSISGVNAGRYCIARGESYHERFLSDKGWQSVRCYFDLIDIASGNNSCRVEPVKENNVETQVAPSPVKPPSKLKTCPYCNEIIPTAMDICPYCSNKGNAPSSDDIDLSI